MESEKAEVAAESPNFRRSARDVSESAVEARHALSSIPFSLPDKC